MHHRDSMIGTPILKEGDSSVHSRTSVVFYSS